MYTIDKEPTLLSPLETAWRCEAWLLDTRYIQHWNQFDEYVFSFAPQTMFDHQALFELIDNARSLVEMRKDRYSGKTRTADTSSYEKNGSLYCSQLFLPKLNIELPYADYLDGKLVSLAGYIRDSVDGRLYLQCSYCDVYEGDEPQPDAAPSSDDASSIEDDW
jgi:hypothetical protein